MPGAPSITETQGQPQLSTDSDFSICVVGYSSDSAVASGELSPAYSSPDAVSSDCGIGDAVDLLMQAITPTRGNPAPPPACLYSTPATTAGSYGAVSQSGTGTAVAAASTAVTPKGTYQPYVVVDAGGTIGTAGITYRRSLDGGRTLEGPFALGTATKVTWPNSEAEIVFQPPAATLTALYAKLIALQGAMSGTGHLVLTSASVHLAADTARDTAVAALTAATTPATAVAMFNSLRTHLAAHGADTAIHTIADGPLATAIAAIPVAVNVADVDLYLDNLVAAYEAHRILTTGTVHGAADSSNTVSAYTSAPGTLVAGDAVLTSTLPPMFSATDLYDSAGPSGAFEAIATSSQLFGVIVLSEPIVSATYDGSSVTANIFSTLVAGLNRCLYFGKRLHLITRFRDPMAGESDAAYILAFQAFRDAFHDSRIEVLAGSGWVTDSRTGRRYNRSFLAPYVARLQSFRAVAGQLGERLAQNPGWVGRGPLEGFSIKDDAGNTIGHDEAARAGIEAANGAPVGSGIACYCLRDPRLAGTYVTNRVSVLYNVGETILTPMDRRVANGIEQIAVSLSWESIGGADIYDPGPPPVLDDDIRTALSAKIAAEVKDKYGAEFQNADDPGLITIEPVIEVNGPAVTITGGADVLLYGYTDAVRLGFKAKR